jgi:PAS domain S-box-containing protein
MSAQPDFQLIVDSSSNGVIAADASGHITYINAMAERILGFRPAQVLGRYITEVLPLTGPLVIKCLDSGEPQLGRHILGKSVDLVVNITTMVKAGRLQGAVCNFQGMREFEDTAQRLQSYIRLNQQFKAIFASSSDGIWVCDGKGTVIDVNEASERLNSIKAEEIIGKNVRDLLASRLFDRSVTLEVLETRRQASVMQYIARTGKYLLATGTPAFDDQGRLFLVVVNERDMTQLNAIREELEHSHMVAARIKDELAELSLRELREQQIVAESEAMRQVLRTALKLARLNVSNILILGESGTGKGLLAKFIHNSSTRRKLPIVQINCAALPETLLEAELFGYEKGAFTGAGEQGKAGLIELAQDGTLFLDEIGDIPLTMQAKLLKYLDDHEVLRLGALKARKVNCTIIAATNRDLEELVKQRRFRRDLFYRLNSFTLRLAPLRERHEDIFELSHYFLAQYNQVYGLQRRFAPNGLEALLGYGFPGNVRELKSIIKKGVVMSDALLLDEIALGLPARITYTPAASHSHATIPALSEAMEMREKELLVQALHRCTSTRQMAALLKTSQPTVVRKLKKHGLPADS